MSVHPTGAGGGGGENGVSSPPKPLEKPPLAMLSFDWLFSLLRSCDIVEWIALPPAFKDLPQSVQLKLPPHPPVGNAIQCLRCHLNHNSKQRGLRVNIPHNAGAW